MDTSYKITLAFNAIKIVNTVHHSKYVLCAQLLELSLMKMENVLNVSKENNYKMVFVNLFVEMVYLDMENFVILVNKMVQEGTNI